MDIENTNSHNMFLYNRNRIELTGITDVIAFSDNSVEAEYSGGTVVIEGNDMKIEDFSGSVGKLSVIGTINGFYYFNKISRDSRRVFGKGRK